MISGDWKDEDLCAQNLHAAHKRLHTRRGKAKEYACVDCGGQACDWSHIHGTTGFRCEHYEPRCRGCHLRYDYTEERKAKISRANKGPNNWLGKSHSEETRAKMRASAYRRHHPD